MRQDEDGSYSNPGDASSSARAQKERMVNFLTNSIWEKEVKLECPVCFGTAEAPIYMCLKTHPIW